MREENKTQKVREKRGMMSDSEQSAKRSHAQVCKKMWACVFKCVTQEVSFCRVCYQTKACQRDQERTNVRGSRKRKEEPGILPSSQEEDEEDEGENERNGGGRERDYF